MNFFKETKEKEEQKKKEQEELENKCMMDILVNYENGKK